MTEEKRENIKGVLFQFWVDILKEKDSDKRDEVIERTIDELEFVIELKQKKEL